MKLLFSILLLLTYGCAKPQNYLLTKYGQAKMGVAVTPLPPPDPEPGGVDSITLNYNTTDWEYLSGYPGKNMISLTAVIPNWINGALGANTGLAWDLANNRLIVVGVASAERRYTAGPSPVLIDSIGNVCTQGCAYNPAIDRYYRLLTTTINIRTPVNGAAGSYTFPYAQPNAGMLDFNFHTGKFLTSYDNYDSVIIWQIPPSGTTLLRVTGWSVAAHTTVGQEGATWDQMDSSVWINGVDKKMHYDSTGIYLGEFAFTGTIGSVNEGYVGDPRDGTQWGNADQGYHGDIPNGNWMWHIDPDGGYNKWLRFPQMIPWSKGLFTGTVTTVGNYNRATLTGTGYWYSPVIAFGSYTLPHDSTNWDKFGPGGLFEYRGSAIVPSTTATSGELPFSYWNANQTNEGWGHTSFTAWSYDPPATPFIQVRIKLIN